MGRDKKRNVKENRRQRKEESKIEGKKIKCQQIRLRIWKKARALNIINAK
jgi:hypothetical protein